MKLYDFAKAPSPRMVRIFMAEKGVEMETIQVDLMTAEQMKPDFAAKKSLVDGAGDRARRWHMHQ